MYRLCIFLLLLLDVIADSISKYPQGAYCRTDTYWVESTGLQYSRVSLHYKLFFFNSTHFTLNITKWSEHGEKQMAFSSSKIRYTFHNSTGSITTHYDGNNIKVYVLGFDCMYPKVKAGDLREMEYDAVKDEVKLKIKTCLAAKRTAKSFTRGCSTLA